jgi:site-specific DNA-methyltransferase (adenine-specific)
VYCGSDVEKSAAAYPINELFTKEIANNIWHITPVPPDYIDKSVSFPEEIP